MDGPNVFEMLGVELASMKTEIRSTSQSLRATKRAVKRKQKELRKGKRVNQLKSAWNRRMNNLVHEFVVAVDADNNDPETAKIWSERAITEAIDGMNDLNNITLNQAGGTAADGDRI